MALVRELFASPEAKDGLEREEAIRELSQRLGFERVGAKIRETLEGDLLAAARRGIIETVDGRAQLFARSIGEYDRNFLKEQFLASLGKSWVDRDDATTSFARWLGFRRTGSRITEMTRSLIRGLLREGRLEARASGVRRA